MPLGERAIAPVALATAWLDRTVAAMHRPAAARYDCGRLGPGSLLWDMYSAKRPVLVGGTAATLTMMLYPPVAHALAAEAERTGRPVNPANRLIPGWLTAIYGDTRQ